MARKTTGKAVAERNGSNGVAAVATTGMPPISDQAVRDLSQVFKLLSDETRLRILLYLAQAGELHVTDLCGRLSQSQPAVSHHLALLRVSGLIEARRDGKHNYYSVRSHYFGELLVDLFSATGSMPKKIRFHQFVLTHEGR
jgi:ArsR family transcriptional regulator